MSVGTVRWSIWILAFFSCVHIENPYCSIERIESSKSIKQLGSYPKRPLTPVNQITDTSIEGKFLWTWPPTTHLPPPPTTTTYYHHLLPPPTSNDKYNEKVESQTIVFSDVRGPTIPKLSPQMFRTKIVYTSGTFFETIWKNVETFF